ncbi:YcgJ family protein [Enterobacter hormaechei]|uniref:YcgJ family protein n=1 Tax=Enterobacter hormaechei TaxID=158836 RepID=UPI0032DA6D89
MNKKYLAFLLLIIGGGSPLLASAAKQNKLNSPAKGIVCDAYFCADAAGLSDFLTIKYLGKKKGEQLASQGKFNREVFTFSNGVYCDTKEKICRKDRYFGTDGKPTGDVDRITTHILFPQ